MSAVFQRKKVQAGWSRTEKQAEAFKLLCDKTFAMLYGGSRSGKTFIIIYGVVLRALKCRSRHLIVRFRYNHAKRSIWHDTLPKVMKLCFPKVPYKINGMDMFIEFENGSQIWIGGIDDKDRTEAILGNEYSTVYCNESSQISYTAVLMLQTRLAEKSGLVNKFFFDGNPPSKKHWTYKLFIAGVDPIDGNAVDMTGYGYLLMNPRDNLANIADGYIENILSRMSAKNRARFIEGQFVDDTEGALWTFDMVTAAKVKESDDIEEVVVSIDPSVTNNETSDECGIIVCGRDANKDGVVIEDLTMRASAYVWAQAAVNAYHAHGASCIVAEVNQGGDLVEMAIHAIDKTIKVVKVHAKKSKHSRAEPIALLYEQGRVAHCDDLDALESEMMEYTPKTSKNSPNRMDAAVYGLYQLLTVETPEPMFRIV